MPVWTDLVFVYPCNSSRTVHYLWHPDWSGLSHLQCHVLHFILKDTGPQTTGKTLFFWKFKSQTKVTQWFVKVNAIYSLPQMCVNSGCLHGLADSIRKWCADPRACVCLSRLHHPGTPMGLQCHMWHSTSCNRFPQCYVQTTCRLLHTPQKDRRLMSWLTGASTNY